MRITGRWNDDEDSKVPKGTARQFHIECKDELRSIMDADPDATGKTLGDLKLEFDERLSKSENEGYVQNELFMATMIDQYLQVYKTFHPGIREKRLTERTAKYCLGLFRIDSAYYSRMSGCMQAIIHNADAFKDINGNHLDELKKLHKWWQKNDHRKRTWFHINWIFTYLLKKYKTDKFYKQSINYLLYFTYLNKDKWVHEPLGDPDQWFGKKRGKLLCDLYGGWF